MPLLVALPATPFELCDWKQATVQFNYHIAVDKDNPEELMPDNNSTESRKPRGITRGASYYGGKKS